jgi:hypothetical protein
MGSITNIEMRIHERSLGICRIILVTRVDRICRAEMYPSVVNVVCVMITLLLVTSMACAL